MTEIGERIQVAIPLSAGDRFVRIGRPDARHLQVRVEVQEGLRCPWRLTIRDSNLRPIQVLSPSDFEEGPSRWTTRVFGKIAYLELQPCPGSATPRIIVSEYIAVSENAHAPYYSLQVDNRPQYRDLFGDTVAPELKTLGDSTAFLTISWERESWTCSGVMLSPTLLLTNWHCGGTPQTMPSEFFWNPQIIRDTLVDLSWDGDTVSWDFAPVELLQKDRNLDFALLRVEPRGSIGAPPLIRIAPARIQSQGQVVLIHHPAAEKKQITSDCSVDKSSYRSWNSLYSDTEFSHQCDTESGSSGAPVFDASGRLVGLHHLGFDFDERTCKQMDRVNKAIHIDAILDALRTSTNHHVKRFLEDVDAQQVAVH